MNKVTPFLWFESNAEEIANFYFSIFPNSRKISELRWPAGGQGEEGSLLVMDLEIEGQQVTFLNGGPSRKLSDAFSFVVRCENQKEIDTYWGLLTEGGSETACGWLKDKFGVAWQVVPVELGQMLRHPKAMQAMMTMKKLDIAKLKEAAEG